MNVSFFRYALEVERTSSISQAAENLFIAQPNLSKAIKDTEDQLGYKIFDRTAKGVTATAKGRVFLEHAREIVRQMEKIEDIASADTEKTQRLSVSMPRGSYISKAMVRFTASLDKSKSIQLNIQETGSMQTITNVASGDFNLGIIRYQTIYEKYFRDYLAEKKLSSDLTWNFNYVVLMSQKHKLADVSTIQPNNLRHSIEIVHGDTQIPYLNTDRIKREEKLEIKQRIYLYERANQFELLSNIPETFMWVSPIPEELCARYGLIQRYCDFVGNNYQDVFIYRNDYEFSELDRRFIDMVSSVRNEVSLKKYI